MKVNQAKSRPTKEMQVNGNDYNGGDDDENDHVFKFESQMKTKLLQQLV